MSGHQPYPLEWPVGKARTRARKRSAFSSLKFAATARDLMAELRRFGAQDTVLSTDVPVSKTGMPYSTLGQPPDPGVAVYFTLVSKARWDGSLWVRDRRYYAIACDLYFKVEENMRALVHTIAAMRTIDRHGGSQLLEQAMSGFTALPPAQSRWREVMEFDVGERATLDDVKKRYRMLVKKRHPDTGGSSEKMAELTAALEEAERELGV